MKIASLPTLIGLAVLASGCGQKGPLVLPDAQHPAHKKLKLPASPKPANAPASPATSPPAPAPAAPAIPEPAAPPEGDATSGAAAQP